MLIFILQNGLQGSTVNANLKIHPNASVHSSVIMEGDIEIGANTSIGANSYLKGPLVIGKDNQIGQQVMIGVDPEHKTKQAAGVVTIGNDNVIREFTVIQRGIGDLDTQIQNNCFIMAYTYIAHDCLIESDAVLCARVSLSGHCHVLKGAILGLSSSVHQFSTIGAHAFVGMGSVVVKDVPPFCMVVGNPAHFEKFNFYPFEQLGIISQDLTIEDHQLKSKHSYISDCVENFNLHVRRNIIPLEYKQSAPQQRHADELPYMEIPSSIKEKLIDWFNFPKGEIYAQVATNFNNHPHIRSMLLFEITSEGYLVFLTHNQTQKWLDLNSSAHIAITLVDLQLGQITVEGTANLKTKDHMEIHRYWKTLSFNIKKIYTDSPKKEVPDTFGVIIVQPTSWEYLELNKIDYNKSVRKQFFMKNGLWESKNLKPL